MSRIYFRKADPGQRGVRGEVIRTIQERLTALGHDTKGLDGIYGRDTEEALRAFQDQHRMEVSGRLDEETWKALLGPEPPRLFDRCLQITADFEGHGFTKAAGDFDGAGLTWGIIGFNFKSGTLPRVLREIDQRSTALIAEAFGDLAAELRAVLQRPTSEQIAWGGGVPAAGGTPRGQRDPAQLHGSLLETSPGRREPLRSCDRAGACPVFRHRRPERRD